MNGWESEHMRGVNCDLNVLKLQVHNNTPLDVRTARRPEVDRAVTAATERL